MRMWFIEPKRMCNKHLLGSHVECHMLVGAIEKGKSLQGYVEKELIDTSKIKKWHDACAREMKRRGMRHESPIYQPDHNEGKVNKRKALSDLAARCKECDVNPSWRKSAIWDERESRNV